MKRCAIFFTLLVLTILVAVLIEHGSTTRTMDEVTMDDSNAMVRQDIGNVLPDKGMND